MSVYYNVKEHLVVKNTHENGADILVGQMKRQLSLLGALMLTGDATIFSIELIVEHTKFRFSGKEVSPELHALLCAMDHGNSMELVADYCFRWSASLDYLNVGPFAVCSCVENLLDEDPEQAENIFYSMYNEADCASGAGVLVAYGKKDGNAYHGQIEFIPSVLPEDGIWENHDTTIVFDADLTDDMDIAAIEQIGRTFAERFPDVRFDGDKSGMNLYVDNLTLHSKSEFEALIDLYSKLIRATNGMCSMIGEFVDLSGKDAVVLQLEIEMDGSYSLMVASVK